MRVPKTILVLGGGQQGSVVSEKLAETGHTIWLSDLAEKPQNHPLILPKKLDVNNHAELLKLVAEADAVVGALPSRFGKTTLELVLSKAKPVVDVSFASEDLRSLDTLAKTFGSTLVCDFGLAPGISNLLAGHLSTQHPNTLEIQVGGFAKDPQKPFGYVVTWSLEDLLEEYTRPARWVQNGNLIESPALSHLRQIEIPTAQGLKQVEAFLTDGLRSLLSLPIPNMKEETLRWPGHINSIKPLLQQHSLVETLRRDCSSGDDVVLMQVKTEAQSFVLYQEGTSSRTAMAKTTAETTAVMMDWLLKNPLKPGVFYPEDLGKDPRHFESIQSALEKNGLQFLKT